MIENKMAAPIDVVASCIFVVIILLRSYLDSPLHILFTDETDKQLRKRNAQLEEKLNHAIIVGIVIITLFSGKVHVYCNNTSLMYCNLGVNLSKLDGFWVHYWEAWVWFWQDDTYRQSKSEENSVGNAEVNTRVIGDTWIII